MVILVFQVKNKTTPTRSNNIIHYRKFSVGGQQNNNNNDPRGLQSAAEPPWLHLDSASTDSVFFAQEISIPNKMSRKYL